MTASLLSWPLAVLLLVLTSVAPAMAGTGAPVSSKTSPLPALPDTGDRIRLAGVDGQPVVLRSEERRVGKECSL